MPRHKSAFCRDKTGILFVGKFHFQKLKPLALTHIRAIGYIDSMPPNMEQPMTTHTRFTYEGAATTINRLRLLGYVKFTCVRTRHGRVTVRAFK